MKKNLIILISCVAFLLAAGGLYVALMLNDGDDKSSSSSAENEVSDEELNIPVSLFDFERADIQSITVKNSGGEFVGIPDGSPEDDGTVNFTIKGLEGLDINTANVSSLLNSAAALNSESTVEESPADLGKYGLDAPAAQVTVKAGSGEKTLLLGDESPVKGQNYCMEKSGNTVYLVSSSNISVFFNSMESFVSTTLYKEPEKEPKIESIVVDRTDIDYDIVFKYDDLTTGTMATHYMAEPVFAYLDTEKSQTVVKGFSGLSAVSVVTAHPSEDEIAAAGLEEPFCTVTIKTDEPYEYVLKLGNKLNTDSVYYLAMYNDNDVIYAISPDSICWDDIKPDDVMSRLIFGTNFADIGKLEISVGSEKTSFEGSGTSVNDYTVTKNGASCDTERFRSLYKYLLKASAEELVLDEQPEGEAIVSIYLETQDGNTKQAVEFYKTDGKKALISVNGTACFKCRMAYVDLLIENLRKFDGSEEFVMNW